MISNSEFNQKLIDTIQDCLPTKSVQVDFLVESIPLSKEAAYRRLRGDVPFSFSEACIVSNRLGKSLDTIAQTEKKDKLLFEVQTFPPEFTEDYNYYYSKLLDEHEQAFDMLLNDPSILVSTACNMIPHATFFPYKYLSRFRAFMWKYQMMQSTQSCKLSDIVISDEIMAQQMRLADKVRILPESTLIYGRNIFMSFISQIKYFYNLKLISDEELTVLKEELRQLVLALELLTIQGVNAGGHRTWIYLSNIDFESNYVYMRGNNLEASFIDIYQMNSIMSFNPSICKTHKLWIESLRKYSTLISASGEKERLSFFEKQKEIIENMV